MLPASEGGSIKYSNINNIYASAIHIMCILFVCV